MVPHGNFFRKVRDHVRAADGRRKMTMNHKNRKPKSYKGCCVLCSLRMSDGRRNGRRPTLQEVRSDDSFRDQLGEPRRRAKLAG